jgi:hypothetical protein
MPAYHLKGVTEMGDRALIIFYDKYGISPTVYLHSNGNNVPELLANLAEYMKGRYGDAGYAAARFTGLCHNMISGNLSLGLLGNTLRRANLENAAVLEAMSHGNAGVVVVNTDDFSWKAYGGYLAERQRISAAVAQLTLITPSPTTT